GHGLGAAEARARLRGDPRRRDPRAVPVGAQRAAGAALALTLLGRTDVSVYDGSLEEWSKDPARPLELGN
ncbi:sulfurtransferase, partial [Streptomyces prunicolor]